MQRVATKVSASRALHRAFVGTVEKRLMNSYQASDRREFPRHDVLDEDDRTLWTLDDLYELSARFNAPLDHEVIVPSEGSDYSIPPPPHGASWDPF